MGWGKRKAKKKPQQQHAAAERVELHTDQELGEQLRFADGGEDRFFDGQPEDAAFEEQAMHGEPLGQRQAPTVLGASGIVRGEVAGDEDVFVEGRVEGKVSIARRLLTIGVGGFVQGDVEAESVRIDGEMHGDVRAADRVEVTANGKLVGNITARRVVIAEGARFKGSIDMEEAEQARPAAPAQPTAKRPKQQQQRPQQRPQQSPPQQQPSPQSAQPPAQQPKRQPTEAPADQAEQPSGEKQTKSSGTSNEALAALFDG